MSEKYEYRTGTMTVRIAAHTRRSARRATQATRARARTAVSVASKCVCATGQYVGPGL